MSTTQGPPSGVDVQPAPFDPTFYQLDATVPGHHVASVVRAASLICLTQDPNAGLDRVLPIDPNADIIVYGDVVRICGPITAPGRDITIACRRLEFDLDTAGKAAGIDVSGSDNGGPLVNKLTARAPDGRDGHTTGDGRLSATTVAAGDPGADGNGATRKAESGGSGQDGGNIRLSCEHLIQRCDVKLAADGYRGADGLSGQAGGDGGAGLDGLYQPGDRWGDNPEWTGNDVAPETAAGGHGGDGGDGGDGGNGGDGGKISLSCLIADRGSMASADGTAPPPHALSVSAVGRDGGNAGDGGNGGDGGKGGYAARGSLIVHPGNVLRDKTPQERSGGGAGGQAGAHGWPGRKGDFGSGGDVRFRWPTGAHAAVSVTVRPGSFGIAPGEVTPSKARDGQPGDGGSGATSDEADSGIPDGPHGVRPTQSRTVPKPSYTYPPRPREPEPRRVGPPTHQRWVYPRPRDWFTLGPPTYTDLAGDLDREQLEMVLEQTRTRFILTDVADPSRQGEVKEIADTLNWLCTVLACPPFSVAPADVSGQGPRSPLLDAATALMTNLSPSQQRNAFGYARDYVPLVPLADYTSVLMPALSFLKGFGDRCWKLVSELHKAEERQPYLNGVDAYQREIAKGLARRKEASVASLTKTLNQLDAIRADRDLASTRVSDTLSDFADQIRRAHGLGIADIVSALTNLSFLNLGGGSHEPAAGAADAAAEEAAGAAAKEAAGAAFPFLAVPMIAGQVLDLGSKAVENVQTDTGVPMKRDYVLRRVKAVGSEVMDFKGITQAMDGFITSTDTGLSRLLVTREKLEQILDNFYETIPQGSRHAKDAIDDLIEVVSNFEAKIGEYSGLLMTLVGISADSKRLQNQQAELAYARQRGAQPSLPRMAAYGSALYTHMLHEITEQIYLASRAYSIESLSDYDVYTDMLGKLQSGVAKLDSLDADTLTAALVEIALKKLDDDRRHPITIEPFEPAGDHCRVVLTEDSPGGRLLFAALRRVDETGAATPLPATFTLRPALSHDDLAHTSFARRCRVRLSAVSCVAEGAKTKDGVLHIELTHTGTDAFVTEDDMVLRFVHEPVALTYEYAEGKVSTGGQLDRQHQTIGPFTTWSLSFPPEANSGLNLSKLTKLTIGFTGTSATPAR